MNVNKVWNELYTKRKMLEFVENLSAYDGLGTEGFIQIKFYHFAEMSSR